MAEVPNGNGAEKTPEELRAQVLSAEFGQALWALWVKYQRSETALPPDVFQRTTCLTILHMAAVLAVDCHINDMQFVGMAKTLWDQAEAKAPKFG